MKRIPFAALIVLLVMAGSLRAQDMDPENDGRYQSDRHLYHVHMDLGKKAMDAFDTRDATRHFNVACSFALKMDPPEHFPFEDLGDAYRKLQSYGQAAWAYGQAISVLSQQYEGGSSEIMSRLTDKLRRNMDLFDAGAPARPNEPVVRVVNRDRRDVPGGRGWEDDRQDAPEVIGGPARKPSGQPDRTGKPSPAGPSRTNEPGMDKTGRGPSGTPDQPDVVNPTDRQAPRSNANDKQQLASAIDGFKGAYSDLKAEVARGAEEGKVDRKALVKRLNNIRSEYGLDQPLNPDNDPYLLVRSRLYSVYGELVALGSSNWDDDEEMRVNMQLIDALFAKLEHELKKSK